MAFEVGDVVEVLYPGNFLMAFSLQPGVRGVVTKRDGDIDSVSWDPSWPTDSQKAGCVHHYDEAPITSLQLFPSKALYYYPTAYLKLVEESPLAEAQPLDTLSPSEG